MINIHTFLQSILASKTNRTTRTIERNIEKLKKQNLIKRIGSRKEGYWKIIKLTKNKLKRIGSARSGYWGLL